MKVGERWKDKTSGAMGRIEGFEGDFVLVRLRDGGMAMKVQVSTFQALWTRWPRKLDSQTQERLREIIRANNVEIPSNILTKPFHVLSLYPITGAVGALLDRTQGQANRNAQERPWVIDIGSYHGGLSENQAERIRRACEEEGIPFWGKQWMAPSVHQILVNPEIYAAQYAEISETFGTPGPTLEDG